MFTKILTFFTIVAVAFAAPSPKPAPAPAPAPQYLAYSTGLDYAYPSAAYVPSVVSAYSASSPLAYSGYQAVNPLLPYY